LQQRNRQVESHRGLVAPIASHYAAQSAEAREDLEQVGLLGLIRAAELYDRSLAVPFSAYARQHVRGAILHYLRDTAPLVRPSRRVQEQRHQRNRLAQELLRRLGRIPTSDDLRLALGLSREQWQRQQVEPWQGRLWHDQQWLAAQEPDDADEAEQAAVVLAELEALQKAQRQVVEAVVLEGLSLREVARRMDSSAATVHRQLHRGLQVLRTRLTAPADAPAC
jgi:RNA polymerase sigma-B factor